MLPYLTKRNNYNNMSYVIIIQKKRGFGMARKISVTKDMLICAAFEITKKEGLREVTARKLASKAGCSTQPIFRIYSGMDELADEVFNLAVDDFSGFYTNYPGKSEVPFVNLGMAYIEYAFQNPQLFKLLFLDDKRCEATLFGILNGKTGALHKEINKAAALGVKNPGDIFMKMWIFIHGAASMVITGDYDLSMEETVGLLENSYKAFTK